MGVRPVLSEQHVHEWAWFIEPVCIHCAATINNVYDLEGAA